MCLSSIFHSHQESDLLQQEAQLEQLRSNKQEVLDKCELEQLKLPTVDDPMQTGTSSVLPVFDYTQLSRMYLQEMRPSEREKLGLDFKQKMDNLMVEIERTAPNLKALDQYEALQGKEKEVVEKFEAARKEEKEITDRYNSVKQKRYCYTGIVCHPFIFWIVQSILILLFIQ